MLDPSKQAHAHADRRLRSEQVAWLTTVRADGQAQSSPVWFLWDGETFLLYSQPGAQKVRNVVVNPKVSLHLGDDGAGDDIVTFEGAATVEPGTPRADRVAEYLAPSNEESSHDFLWRYHSKAPPKGMIHIFNRSHYEDVLIVRVKDLVPESVWRPRYEAINQFEYALTADGVTVLKFFLHISRDEQKRRLESRLADPDKRWKFSSNDLKERAYWDDYQAAFEDAVNECSTDYAPWYVVPANNKWYRNLVVARTIADTLEAMNPKFPAAEKGLDKTEIPD